jgi:hypothetical protein
MTGMRMQSKYVIEDASGWDALRTVGLTTVLDPMIFRAGELFLAGGGGADAKDPRVDGALRQPRGPRRVLRRDHPQRAAAGLRLRRHLPGGSGGRLGTSRGVVPSTNQTDPILVPVKVKPGAYNPMKTAAMAEWDAHPPVDVQLRRALLLEMRAFDHVWEPQLEGTENLSDEDRKLAILVFGGLLFSAYSQRLRGTHVLQSKRARLLGGVALGTASEDAELFARLAELPEVAPDAVSSAQDLPKLPSFLPYLIAQGPRSSHDLLRAALRERKDDDVKAYREWRSALIDELALGGAASKKRRELTEVHERLDRKLSPSRADAKVSLEMLGLVVPVPKAEVGVAADVRPRAAWGWCVRKVKGDHRKVLARLAGGQKAFTRLDTQVGEVWRGRAGPIAR